MRTSLLSLLALLFLLGLAPATHAHIGDEIYPFYELLDEELHRMDLTDASVEDWLEVVGEPSLTASDFVWGEQYDRWDYDPSDVDFRIWLAWHQGSSTIWAAMERVDDLYVNLYDGDDLGLMVYGDSSIIVRVDGDHSGGRYSYLGGPLCEWCTPEQVQEDNRQAQSWLAIGEAPDSEHLLHLGGAREWVGREPYAAAGGGTLGRSPAVTVTELKVTAFDDLIHDDEDASVSSDLYPGKVIGFEIWTHDNDDPTGPAFSGVIFLSLSDSERRPGVDAGHFVDGLLLGAGEDPSRYDDISAVAPSSWARIKASFK